MSLAARIGAFIARLTATRYRTAFGTARVYEIDWNGSRLRVLDVDGTYQSATFLDERWCDVPFPYLARYDLVFATNHPPRDICMLGGGGYAYPKHVIAHHSPARIDVVEVDPAITGIAHEHFFLDRLRATYGTDRTGRLGLVCADAWSYLQQCARQGRTYDAILNDCFAAERPDEQLLSASAAVTIHACLRPNGIYATNVISALEGDGAEPLMDQVASLSAAFDHVCVQTSSRTAPYKVDNVLLVATDDPHPIADTLPLYDAL